MITQTTPINHSQYIALQKYRHIYLTYPFQMGTDVDDPKTFPRVARLNDEEKAEIAQLYKDWRGEAAKDEEIDCCNECLNETFNRLMVAMIEYEKAKPDQITDEF